MKTAVSVRIVATKPGRPPLQYLYVDIDPTVRGAVEVDMTSARHSATHHSAGNKEVPLAATAVETTSIKVSAP